MTRIILTVEDDLTIEEIRWLRYTLADALSDFRRTRKNSERGLIDARAYVNERYPVTSGYDWMDRDAKADQVHTRCQLAQKLHDAALGAEIETSPTTVEQEK